MITLDDTQAYAAVVSRDARFDGRFFTAVTTTGIYCRPVCPARTPRRENVRFFPCAAAAEAAGFRPCLRCRPEAAPGSAAWDATSATVTRALRLIDGGALDDGDVAALAARLGMGDRQLRRLFARHLGVSPVACAGVRRVQFAKRLLDQMPLSVSEVALAAGFSSIRRFNDAFKASFGAAPGAMRALARAAEGDASPLPQDALLALRLSARPPCDLAGTLSWLAGRAIPGVEEAAEGVYRRTIALGDAAGILTVRLDEAAPGVVVEVPASLSRHLLEVTGRARRIFDLDADPLAVGAHLGTCPRLGPLVAARPGLRVPGAWDGFELGVRAILGQQVSVAGARTLAHRLVAAFGRALPGASEGLHLLFPTPAALRDADVERVGMPTRRAQAIRLLAAGVDDGRIDLSGRTATEDVWAALTALPGVGPWTASYIALRALGDPDAFPAGDLILRRAAALPGEAPLTERALLARAEAWRPWRAYAALHLWKAPA